MAGAVGSRDSTDPKSGRYAQKGRKPSTNVASNTAKAMPKTMPNRKSKIDLAHLGSESPSSFKNY